MAKLRVGEEPDKGGPAPEGEDQIPPESRLAMEIMKRWTRAVRLELERKFRRTLR